MDGGFWSDVWFIATHGGFLALTFLIVLVSSEIRHRRGTRELDALRARLGEQQRRADADAAARRARYRG